MVDNLMLNFLDIIVIVLLEIRSNHFAHKLHANIAIYIIETQSVLLTIFPNSAKFGKDKVLLS